jgi:hypothetical protein
MNIPKPLEQVRNPVELSARFAKVSKDLTRDMLCRLASALSWIFLCFNI